MPSYTVAPLSEVLTPADDTASAIEGLADRHGFHLSAYYREEREDRHEAIAVHVRDACAPYTVRLQLEFPANIDYRRAVPVVDAALRALAAG